MEKELLEDQLVTLERLVDELIKDEPQEDLIQSMMAETGIPYCDDPVDRINRVLRALHFSGSEKSIK